MWAEASGEIPLLVLYEVYNTHSHRRIKCSFPHPSDWASQGLVISKVMKLSKIRTVVPAQVCIVLWTSALWEWGLRIGKSMKSGCRIWKLHSHSSLRRLLDSVPQRFRNPDVLFLPPPYILQSMPSEHCCSLKC